VANEETAGEEKIRKFHEKLKGKSPIGVADFNPSS